MQLDFHHGLLGLRVFRLPVHTDLRVSREGACEYLSRLVRQRRPDDGIL